MLGISSLLKLVSGGDVAQKGTPAGANVSCADLDWLIGLGYGRRMTMGAFSTGLVGGGAGTILDLDQPEACIAVPSGYCIRPIRIDVQVQTGLIAADNDENEILLAVDSLGYWTGDGTFTTENPSNMKTSVTVGSVCRCGTAFTADMTTTPTGAAAADPVLDMELARVVQTVDISTAVAVNMKELRLVYEPLYPEYLVGPCSLLLYFGGTVANIGGFAQFAWVEGPSSLIVPS